MTTNPEPIPTKLNAMCRKVNADAVMPNIMMRLPLSVVKAR